VMHSKEHRYYMHYGHVQFTEIGYRLFRIAGAEQVPTFFDVLESQWVQMGFKRQLV
jgi:hypothetical protein